MPRFWGQSVQESYLVALESLLAGERNPTSSTNAYLATREEWNWTVLTGVTGDQAISTGVPAHVKAVRVGAAAALAGAVQVKDGATVKDTLAIGAAANTERDYKGARCETSLVVNMANAADVVHIFWRPL